MPYFVYPVTSIRLEPETLIKLISSDWEVLSITRDFPFDNTVVLEWSIRVVNAVQFGSLQNNMETIVLEGYPEDIAPFAIWLTRKVYPGEISVHIFHDSSIEDIEVTSTMDEKRLVEDLRQL